jgi:pimeloyl-ACP methyl ester carboxylesterase
VRTSASRRFVGPTGSALHVSFDGPREGERVVVLHEAGERAASITTLLAALSAAGFNVLSPDLPGHGESAPLVRGEPSPLEATAERIADEFAGAPVTLLGLGAGATVALAAAQSGRMSVSRVIAWQPLQWPSAQRAAIIGAFAGAPTPDWHGGHLSNAWHRARDAGLYHPWCQRLNAHAWQDEPRVNTLEVHERCVALLLSGDAGPALAAAAVADDLRARIEALDVPVDVVLDAASPAAYLDHLRVLLQGSRATLAKATDGPAAAIVDLVANAGMN